MKKCKTCKYFVQAEFPSTHLRCARLDRNSGGASSYFEDDAAFVVSEDLKETTMFVGPEFGCVKHERQTKRQKKEERAFLEAFDGALNPPLEENAKALEV